MIALQLNPPIPVRTPKGKGMAQVLIDYGVEHNLMWVVFLATGECWTFQNRDIRADLNETIGRHKSIEPHDVAAAPYFVGRPGGAAGT